MQVATLLEEYYATGDLAEAAAELEDMAEPELQHFLVKRAVAMALDKHNREREMICLLLSSLYSEVCVLAIVFSRRRIFEAPAFVGCKTVCLMLPFAGVDGIELAWSANVQHEIVADE